MKRTVLTVEDLRKTFKKPFSGKKVEAVRGISFTAFEGEIFGFLGPNGAGKTTTIKMLTGLIAPTSGRATILGETAPSPEAMKRVGFLPENPYIYPYLSPREFVTLCAQLSGVPRREVFGRVERIIERVGISSAIDRPARNLSKGMLQRTGLAAALVHEPELLILDEPMSGLDPVGRKEVRDLIVEERKSGRAVFFSSHILSDVEMLCDRVCILKSGSVVLAGAVRELVTGEVRSSEITLDRAPESLVRELAEMGHAARAMGEQTVLDVTGEAAVRAVLEKALASGAVVESVVPKRETLEQIFVRRAL
ncbi:MAG: ABC transporter ATP-binding protein [Polyangiaceae bacterium]